MSYFYRKNKEVYESFKMQTKEYLKELHKVEVEILDEIVRICEKHSLKYYLIGGTLLGAIRHNGFIPWDDDLDIVMPRADYDKFCEICKTELDEKYYLHNIDTDDKYWLIHAKVRKNNTVFDEKNIAHIDCHKGIFVDIFPLDNAPNMNSKEQLRRTRKIKAISTLIYRKSKLNIKYSFKSKILASCLFFVSVKTLKKYQLKLMTKFNNEKCDYYINYGSNYDTVKQTMLKSKYEPSCEVEFEGKRYKTLGEYKYFLERIYGADYMQLPPEEKRATHMPLRISFDTTSEEIATGEQNEKI